jgi:tRNA threonylcarbamoyladenosine biosynthesis protein TsaB
MNMFLYFCREKRKREMACILHLETSTQVCSVALSVDGNVVFEKIACEGPSHAALLGVFADEAVTFARKQHYRLQAVALSSGPGSYTGLRIGTSLAKGLCLGREIPLIAVPTLKVLTLCAIRRHGERDGLYCAMLDARRMEVYSALYDARLTPVSDTKAEIVTPETFRTYLAQGTVYFFGNGASKCQAVIDSAKAVFWDNIHPLATGMVAPAGEAFEAGTFEDAAYFEPFYLKEFMATIPKNKVLGISGEKKT